MLRRDALRLVGLGAMSTPRPDQVVLPPGAVVAPGSQTGVFRGRLVVISGGGPPGSGLFVYFPAPGPGKLIASIAAQNGDDPYGNLALQGIAAYGNSDAQAVLLNGGSVQFIYNVGADQSLGFISMDGSTTGGVITAQSLIRLAADAGFMIGSASNNTATVIIVTRSGDVTGAQDTANITNALAISKTVILLPGTYFITAGSIVLGVEQYLVGAGRYSTLVECVGGAGGIFIRQFNPTSGGGGLFGGGVSGLTVDGGSAGAGAVGLEYGDNEQGTLDLAVQHFNGAGSIGVWLNNTIWFTEQLHGTIFGFDNTTDVQFDVNPASMAHTPAGSFGYLDLTVYTIKANAGGQNCVNITNGANVYNGRLVIKGNMTGSASVLNTYTLSVNGVAPAGSAAPGNPSRIFGCELDMQVEVPSGSAHPPYTIFFDTGCTILACRGTLDFTQGTGTFRVSNLFIGGNANRFGYTGQIVGDFNLYPADTFSPTVTTASYGYAINFMNGATGDVFINSGDFFSCQVSANITINLVPAGETQTMPCPQRKIIKIQQAAVGGPFTVTWPNPGAPTTSNPAVHWTGGGAPALSAGANQVDVYQLVTFDGAVWFGTVLGQNMA